MNFIKEAINRIEKFELQNQIMQFPYPRLERKNIFQSQQQHHKLPTKAEISSVISQCKHDALYTAIKFNLISPRSTETTEQKATACHINEYIPEKTINSGTVSRSNQCQWKNSPYQISESLLCRIMQKKKSGPITETSLYIELLLSCSIDPKRIVIKKRRCVGTKWAAIGCWESELMSIQKK